MPRCCSLAASPRTSSRSTSRCGQRSAALASGQRSLARAPLQFPLSPYQAFAIALSTLDPKLADSKTYDKLRRMRGGK